MYLIVCYFGQSFTVSLHSRFTCKSCTNVLLLDCSPISLPPDMGAPPKPPKNMLNISSGVMSASEEKSGKC